MLITFHYYVPNVAAALEHIRRQPAYASHADRLQRNDISEEQWLRDRVVALFKDMVERRATKTELLSGTLQMAYRGLGCVFTPIGQSTGPSFAADLPVECEDSIIEISFYSYADGPAPVEDSFAGIESPAMAIAGDDD
jgi:hypothetical protein